MNMLPSYDDRRAMLAKDPLASCEGFHVLVQLALRHLFGVRYCPKCPDCSLTDNPCTDAMGSNAMPCGGILGRVDAAYGAIEFQKAGPAHVHFQLFVQCLHQHTPLSTIVKMYPSDLRQQVKMAGMYNAHARRTVYVDPKQWEETQRADVEEEWPEFRNSSLMLSRPQYQSDPDMTAAAWKTRYLDHDVDLLQQRKQHHVHIAQEPGGPRLPLAHCRDPRDPKICKAGAT